MTTPIELAPTVQSVDKLQDLIRSCDYCGQLTTKKVKGEVKSVYVVDTKGATPLTESSTRPVPVDVNGTKYLFVGEAPGEHEDIQGLPFVGKSGMYLKEVLIRKARIKLSDCSFANVVKCHPESNRNPLGVEIRACSSWLDREIELIKPDYIVLLGKVAAEAILKKSEGESFAEMKGRVYLYKGIPTTVTYHPAGKDRAVAGRVIENDFERIRSRFTSTVLYDTSGVASLVTPLETTTTVTTWDDWNSMIPYLDQCTEFGFDIETNESSWTRNPSGPTVDPLTNELAGFSVAVKDVEGGYRTWYVSTTDHPDKSSSLNEQAIQQLQTYFDSKTVFMHNAAFEMSSLAKYGVKFPIHNVFDTMYSAYVLRHEHLGLKTLVSRIFGVKMTELGDLYDLSVQQVKDAPLREVAPYGAADAEWTLRLGLLHEQEMIEWGVDDYYNQLMMPFLPWVVQSKLDGMELDVERFKELEVEFDEEIAKERLKLLTMGSPIIDSSFNVRSSIQKADLLYNKLELPIPKRTKTGKPSTDKEEVARIKFLVEDEFKVDSSLMKVRQDSQRLLGLSEDVVEKQGLPIADSLLRITSLEHVKSTYLQGLPKKLHPVTGRLHTEVMQTRTATSRLSYADPNWQNLPVRIPTYKQLREGLAVPVNKVDPLIDPWWVVSFDQSQIELRWGAHLSQDNWMMETLSSGRSIHKEMCQFIYVEKLKLITGEDDPGYEEVYKKTKNGNFCELFHGGEYKLADTIGSSVEFAKEVLELQRDRHPDFNRWQQTAIRLARRLGYAETEFGFRRLIPELKAHSRKMKSEGERYAINVPIQGGAAGHLKMVMGKVLKYLEEKQLRTKLKLQVHDELMFFIPEREIVELLPEIVRIMETGYSISLPTPVDVEIGKSFGKVKDISQWLPSNKLNLGRIQEDSKWERFKVGRGY